MMGKRKLLCATIWLVAFMGFLAGLEPGRANPERDKPLEWGLYQILWSRQYDKQIRDEVAKFASKPNYIMFYRDLGRPFPKIPMNAIAEQGATTIVSLELWSWHGGRSGSYLPAIAKGEYDEFFKQWAQDAKRDGRRVLLRFGFEFNGDWFTWGGDPEGFVSAWRHAHKIFQQVGAANVEWVWAPNVVSCPGTPENDMHRYYPGDAYVDWIGVDGYNFGDHHDKWHTWESFEKIYTKILAGFAKHYAHKPVMISEIGCAIGDPKDREQWYRDAHAAILRNPQVKATIWFNFDKRREKEPNFRIDATPGALKAFNETFAAPRRKGGGIAP